ncbi:MAG: hypothetical protein QXR35_03935 [Candidatus Korarchaeum sp.]
MMELDELKREIAGSIRLKMNSDSLLEHVRKNLSRDPNLKPVIGAKGKGVIVMKELIEVEHPVLRKLVDYGNMSKKLNSETGSLISEIVGLLEFKDAQSLKRLMKLTVQFLESVKEVVVELMVSRVVESEGDLRPTMMPGSVGRGEVPNLYMPQESYGEGDRIKLALQFFKSIAVGKWVSVYFEGPFQDYLKHLVRRKFNRAYLEGEDIGASGWEMSEPFVTLLRLLLWVYGEIAAEKERDEILNMIRSSSGVVYFTPADEERHTAFSFPQLSRFVDLWLVSRDRREALEEMLNSLKRFCASSFMKGREAASKQIEVLHRYLNLLAISLLEGGDVPWEPLRRIVDLILGLSDRYRVTPDLHFVMRLGEMGGPGRAEEGGRGS